MFKYFLSILFLLFFITPSFADLKPVGMVPGTNWLLEVEPETTTCAVSAKYNSNITFGVLNVNGNYFFILGNPSWSLNDGQKIDLVLVFDGNDSWNGTFVAGPSFILSDGSISNKFLSKIAFSNNMTIFKPNGALIAGFTLTGTQKAISVLDWCLGKLQNTSNPFSGDNSTSPTPFGE